MRKLSLLIALPFVLAIVAPTSTASAEPPGCRTVQGASSSFLWCENHLTKMSPAERSARLMPAPYVPDPSLLKPETRDLPNGVPTDPAFSWHDDGGDDWMTPVRDQKSCGSCFVFGTLGALEGQLKVATGNPWIDVDLSEQSVISCIALGSCGSGGTAEEVGNRLKNEGATDEACYPYLATDGTCADLCGDWKERRVLIDDWHMSWLPWSVEEIKAQLVKTPVISQMQVYTDFYGYKTGVYSRADSAKADGWHVVTIVGWDDADNSWIARNSWGDDWGDGGYFKITRETDCTLTLQGLCFALHVNYLDVDPSTTPGMPCLQESELHLHARVGEQDTGSVEVSNCGKAWSVDIESEPVPSWLEATLGDPSLGAGQSTDLNVVASAASLDAGSHEALVRLRGGPGVSTLRVVFEVEAVPEPKPEPGPEPGPEAGVEPGPEAGPQPGSDAGPEGGVAVRSGTAPEDDGCGCGVVGSVPRRIGAWLALGLAGLWFARRRR